MGTTAIWLTPSFKNRPVQGAGDQASAGYHGYWVTDFTQIDPHFGTNAELEALHRRGPRRAASRSSSTSSPTTPPTSSTTRGGRTPTSARTPTPTTTPRTGSSTTATTPAATTSPQLDAAVVVPLHPGLPQPRPTSTVKVPAWLNDPTNYHNRGDSTFAGESSTYGDFVGLDDLFTEQPDVVDGMIDIYETWVDFGIDGFRIDTVKHVNMEFWQKFAPAIRAAREARRQRRLLHVRRGLRRQPGLPVALHHRGRACDATLDFGFQGKGTGFAKGGPTDQAARLLRRRRLLHRHRLQRVLARRRSSATTTWAASASSSPATRRTVRCCSATGSPTR